MADNCPWCWAELGPEDIKCPACGQQARRVVEPEAAPTAAPEVVPRRFGLVRAAILGLGLAAIMVCVIYWSTDQDVMGFDLPLMHAGVAACYLSFVRGRRRLGWNLAVIGALFASAAGLWNAMIRGSEDYPPSPLWPTYALGGIAAAALAAGVTLLLLDRRRRVAGDVATASEAAQGPGLPFDEATQTVVHERRRSLGWKLLLGGAVVTAGTTLNPLLMFVVPWALGVFVVGAVFLGRRGLWATLLAMGVTLELFVVYLLLHTGDEIQRSAGLAATVWGGTAAASLLIALGLARLLQARRGGARLP